MLRLDATKLITHVQTKHQQLFTEAISQEATLIKLFIRRPYQQAPSAEIGAEKTLSQAGPALDSILRRLFSNGVQHLGKTSQQHLAVVADPVGVATG